MGAFCGTFGNNRLAQVAAPIGNIEVFPRLNLTGHSRKDSYIRWMSLQPFQ